MATPASIAVVPSAVDGEVLTIGMWDLLQTDLDQGVVEQVGVVVARGANQSVPAATLVVISFDTDVQDVYGMWALADPTHLIAPVQGWYSASCAVTWDTVTGTATQTCETHIRVNDADHVVRGLYMNDDANHPTYATADTDVYLNAGDTVSFAVVQRLGATHTVTSARGVLVRV